jgi:hypothetical protein
LGCPLKQIQVVQQPRCLVLALNIIYLTGYRAALPFVYGSYLEDTSDVSANGNNVGTISFDLRLYPVNGEKFNLYIGPEVGYSFLEIRKLNPSLGNIEEVSNYSGGHVGVNLGFNWYLFSFAGVFAQAEYTRNDFTLKQYYIDGETFDLTNWDASLNTFSGAMYELGCVLK